MIREAVAAYEEEIRLERSRLGSLRTEWARAQYAATDMDKQGMEEQARAAQLVAHELWRRVRATEGQVERMEQILGDFRRELAEAQHPR